MELKFWIYGIIAVIYVLRWISKNSASKQAAMPTPEIKDFRTPKRVEMPTTDPGKPKPLTFEELLREITDAKTIQETPKPVSQPVYADYDDNLGDEEQDLETIKPTYRQNDNIYEVYEEAKKQAFYRPSLEETMKIQDTDVKFGKFKAFEQVEERNLLSEYVKDLQDKDGFKKAFVLSEILKPRFSNAY